MCLCVCVSVYLCVCVSVCLSTFILSMRKSVGPNENAVLQNGQFHCTLKTRQLRRYERQIYKINYRGREWHSEYRLNTRCVNNVTV